MILTLIFSVLAHAGEWAELDENMVVKRIIIADQNFVAHMPGTWVETTDGVKKNHGAVGGKYDPVNRVFVPAKPAHLASWTFDKEALKFVPPKEPPAAAPDDYEWDESRKDWKKKPQDVLDRVAQRKKDNEKNSK